MIWSAAVGFFTAEDAKGAEGLRFPSPAFWLSLRESGGTQPCWVRPTEAISRDSGTSRLWEGRTANPALKGRAKRTKPAARGSCPHPRPLSRWGRGGALTPRPPLPPHDGRGGSAVLS